MFSALPVIPRDPLWKLTEDFRDDPRNEKIDLILGVYKNEQGLTPVMKAVKLAEIELAYNGFSKVYRPLTGNPEFNVEIAKLVLGKKSKHLNKTATAQTVGGAGALRMLGEAIAWANPHATVWVSRPGYINHEPIMRAAGLNVDYYPWNDEAGQLELGSMLDTLKSAKNGDVLLIQGCCHNPSGVDPNIDQWDLISEFCQERGIIPLVDIAYQGLGNGMEDDAAGLRLMVDRLDIVLIASSCSKNMGLYCERIGAAIAVVKEKQLLPKINAAMEQIARRTYSMPPEHGAAVALSLLKEPGLWMAELDEMRNRIIRMRYGIWDAFQHYDLNSSFKALAQHRGMFSLLPLNIEQIMTLRNDYSIYCNDEGRINIAGLTEANIEYFAHAIRTISK
jgi:aspartate aminotransferase